MKTREALGQNTRIVVIGGGYAGTMAANRLSGTGSQVTVVNARPQFVDRIRLHQWAAGTGEAAHDLGTLLADGVRLVIDNAVRIDADRRLVVLRSGNELPYDYLVYAAGSTGTPHHLIPGLAEHGFGVGDWESAQRLREHLTIEKGPVTVVGGGLTGVETAAELAELGHPVRLVCDGPLVPSFGDRGRRATARTLDRLGVRVFDDRRVTAIGARSITVTATDTTEEWPSATTIVAVGFGIPRLAADSGLTTDPDGRLVTDETLTSVDDPRIVAAGDAASPSGIPLRMSCQAAGPLGIQAADTVLARIAGDEPKNINQAFAGQCISIGRNAGTVQLCHSDDSPRRVFIGGRTGALLKEQVCRATLTFMRKEGRKPGSYFWFKGDNRARQLEAARQETLV